MPKKIDVEQLLKNLNDRKEVQNKLLILDEMNR